MKIDLSILTQGIPVSLEYRYNPTELEINNHDIEFIEDLAFKGEAEKGDGFLLVRGVVTSRWRESCSRCLARIEREYKRDVNLSFSIEKDQSSLDFTPELREEMLLSIPVKVLCREDCKGLCSNCGANLNVDSCGCKDAADQENPFNILKKIKEEKE